MININSCSCNFQFKNYNEEILYVQSGAAFIGWYKDGFAHGSVWIEMIGGGLLHGKIQETDHKLTGDEIMYLYPDYDTMFVGTFEDKMMIKAKEASLKQVSCDEKTGLPIITAYDLAQDDVIYYYDPPTNISFGGGSLGVLDPFERKNLELRESSIPNSGDGVFSKVELPVDDHTKLVSIYASYTYNPEQDKIYYDRCAFNTSKSDDERRHCMKYRIMSCVGEVLNIPPEIDTPETVLPTLAPKINHHFTNANCLFACLEHPRFGTIIGAFKKPFAIINAGDELFSNYGYKKNPFPQDVPWYWEAKNKLDKERPKSSKIKKRKTPKTLQ